MSLGLDRFVRRAFLPLLLAIGVAWVWGLVSFVNNLPKPLPLVPGAADGIVILTGGPDRIRTGMALLNQGAAPRLLISGVFQDTSRDDLRQLIGRSQDRFDCCVDVGRVARNTTGNAHETAEWAREKGYKKLIVVTAAFHMPRSLLELRRTMPGVEFIPYPVVSTSERVDGWWKRPATIRKLSFEYTKYMFARVRLAVLS